MRLVPSRFRLFQDARTSGRRSFSVVLLVIAAVGFGVSCGDGQQPDPTVGPTSPAVEDRAGALAAYDGFWQTTNQAFAQPGARDWRPELSKYASGPALDAVLTDVKNYATFPAHKVGQPARSPQVDSVLPGQPARVVIIDCLDVRNVRLVADRTGADLGDTTNQPPRFRYRAEVIRAPNQERWLVEATKPLLDQPC
ncbi:MAG: hypothetical protein H0W01_15360 [Pseudonocardiales bacterium]|nr:hypothetical protein [Pseudonocardiales bacterium]